MKTLTRTFRFVVLSVIVILVVASCCNFPFPSIFDTKSYAYLEIGHPLGRPTISPTVPPRTYVEWKNEGDFDTALAQVHDHGGKICVCVLKPGGTPYAHKFNNDCRIYKCPPENIRTVKITKSKAADNIAAGDSAANDPHVTYRVQSPYPGDIIKVLGTLKSVP